MDCRSRFVDVTLGCPKLSCKIFPELAECFSLKILDVSAIEMLVMLTFKACISESLIDIGVVQRFEGEVLD